jgi:hypothetical protein
MLKWPTRTREMVRQKCVSDTKDRMGKDIVDYDTIRAPSIRAKDLLGFLAW